MTMTYQENKMTQATRRIKISLLSLLALFSVSASAQCTFRNTAFKSGERLSYNLYFNWKFVWVKVGTASFDIDQTRFLGKKAYKGSLITSAPTASSCYATRCCATTRSTWHRSTIAREPRRASATRWTRCITPIQTASAT